MIIDKTAYMDSSVSGMPYLVSKHILKAYKGLVPISPKIIPIAAIVTTAKLARFTSPVEDSELRFLNLAILEAKLRRNDML